MRTLRRTAAAGLRGAILMAIVAGPATAQVPTLDRVDSLVTAGAYEAARSTLDRWWSAREAFDVPGSDRVRAHMLRAGLQTRPADAESDYLAVILGYPTSDHAPRALLRLGQGLHASGQYDRAAGYLQRLVADYAGRAERSVGILWLARAQNAARRSAAACRTARMGITDAGDRSELTALLRIEEAAACRTGEDGPQDRTTASAGLTEQDAPSPSSGDRQTPEPNAQGIADQPAASGRFAAQTGAFRMSEGAEALMARLRDRGYEPRAVLVPANSLLRVRVGRFATAAEAARAVAALKEAGFDAFVVGDVAQERNP